MKKLVRLDAGGWLTEIDMKAMHREARALQAYIQTASLDEELLFQYRSKVLPLICAALEGRLQIPYKGEAPYSWQLMFEGLAPKLTGDFSNLYSLFMNRIAGSSTLSALSVQQNDDTADYVPDIIEKDGWRYEWVNFED
jgi:hypothetical protein